MEAAAEEAVVVVDDTLAGREMIWPIYRMCLDVSCLRVLLVPAGETAPILEVVEGLRAPNASNSGLHLPVEVVAVLRSAAAHILLLASCFV